MITVITATGDRPEAFALCKKYMMRQTQHPDQWLIIDDGEKPGDTCSEIPFAQYIRREDPKKNGPTLNKQMFRAFDLIRGDKVIIMEDDDWYHPNYIKDYGIDLNFYYIVGQAPAIYYNVRDKTYKEFKNSLHSSLCATGFSRSILSRIRECCKGDPFMDLRIWKLDLNKKLSAHKLVLGIKGMPGRAGIGKGHRALNNKDADLSYLKHFIGEDYKLYV